MRRQIFTFFIIFLLLLPLIGSINVKSASANSFPFIGISSQNNVNVHRGAIDSYKVSGILSKGEEVYVLSSFTNQKNEIWLQIKNDYKSGWVKQNFIVPATFSPTTMIVTTNIGSNLNVRSGPSTSFSFVKSVSSGQQVVAIDRQLNEKNELWYKIQLDNQDGWVSGDYLSPLEGEVIIPNTPEVVYASESLYVRRGALSSYAITAKINKGEAIKVNDTFTNNNNELWYNVELPDGKFGWVYSLQTQTSPIVHQVLYVNINSAV